MTEQDLELDNFGRICHFELARNLALNRITSMHKLYFVYILTNPSHTVFYTGMTNNLVRRLEEHKQKIHPKSFTAKYNCTKLIYFES